MISETSRTVNISVGNIEDKVVELLSMVGYVSHNEKIGPLQWGEMTKDAETGEDVIPITFHVRKEA